MPNSELSAEMEDRWDELTQFGVTRGDIYTRARTEGASPRFAEMAALQQGPSLRTDSDFFKGMKRPGDDMGEKTLQHRLSVAKAHGFTPSPGAHYQPGLARFPGDPEAWVAPTDGRGYIKRLCEKRGWACEGSVEVQAREPESDPHEPERPLADDLVAQNAARMAEKDPGLKELPVEALKEKVIKERGPSDG